MRPMYSLCGLALLAVVSAGGVARAQGPQPVRPPQAPSAPDSISRSAPLSLQSQLGAIPLVSPRAAAQASRMRTVRVTQVPRDGEPAREAREFACPETGCQQVLSLIVDDVAQSFLADIQFVSHGAYVTLQPRSVAIARVVEFRQGRPGPVFIRGLENTLLEDQISYVTTQAASLRRVDGAADGRTLTSGNFYVRKREPDMVLKVEIAPPQARQ
jgi:hypothetical protein